MDIPVSYRFYNFGIPLGSLFGNNTTLLLNNFSSAVSNVDITSDSGILYVGEQVPVGGREMTMIGSGFAIPGVSVLGLIVPLGTPRDLILMQDNATGNLVFAFPDGEPNILSALALVVSVDEVGYNANSLNPVCFAAGTRIATPDGLCMVERLRIGDRVMTLDGKARPIRWIMSSTHRAPGDTRWPIVFAPGSLARGRPYGALRLSPQHRVVLPPKSPGEALRLAPALAFVGQPGIAQEQAPAQVTYVHFLMDRHFAVLAEGVGCESLLLTPKVLQTMGAERRADLASVMRMSEAALRDHPAARPCGRLLRRRDAVALLERRRAAGWALCTTEIAPRPSRPVAQISPAAIH